MGLEIKIPAVGESITEATIGEWTKKTGDYVNQDDILLVLETDKASVEVVAEKPGVLTIKVEEGETVPIGEIVGEIDTDASAPAGGATPPAEAPQAAAPPQSAPASSTHPDLQKTLSPAVQRVVNEKGLDPSQIQGTGKGGRLTKSDAMGASAPAPAAAPASAPTPIPPLPVKQALGERGQRREKMSTLRKRIAERLVESQHTTATLTTFNEVDMSTLKAVRAKYKDLVEKKYGVRLGFMGFFVKACIEALKDCPLVNAYIDGNDVVFNDAVNIGVAVGAPKGLIVPVVKDADLMSVVEIEAAIRHYALKARDGKISVDDLSGGTFTVSNGGVYGSLMSTPILNPPQSGILGMHKVEDRPVVVDGNIVIRPMMYLALSYDHRIIDGKEAVTFLVKVKEAIEDPTRMLLEV